jgi:hypothetical protein
MEDNTMDTMDATDTTDTTDATDTTDTADTTDTTDTTDATDMMDAMDMDMNDDQYPEQHATLPPIYTELYPGASDTFGQGETYMKLFDEDEHAEKRKKNLYYPFASQPEWELASFLLRSGLSMKATDEFLKLQMVSADVPP